MIDRNQFNQAFRLIEELDQLDNIVSQPEQLVAPLLPESLEKAVLRANLAIVNQRRMEIKDQLKSFEIKA